MQHKNIPKILFWLVVLISLVALPAPVQALDDGQEKSDCHWFLRMIGMCPPETAEMTATEVKILVVPTSTPLPGGTPDPYVWDMRKLNIAWDSYVLSTLFQVKGPGAYLLGCVIDDDVIEFSNSPGGGCDPPNIVSVVNSATGLTETYVLSQYTGAFFSLDELGVNMNLSGKVVYAVWPTLSNQKYTYPGWTECVRLPNGIGICTVQYTATQMPTPTISFGPAATTTPLPTPNGGTNRCYVDISCQYVDGYVQLVSGDITFTTVFQGSGTIYAGNETPAGMVCHIFSFEAYTGQTISQVCTEK